MSSTSYFYINLGAVNSSMESGQHCNISNFDKPTSAATEEDNVREGDSSSNAPSVDVRSTYGNEPILMNLQNVSYIYRQDVVKSKTNSKIGIVTEVAGDSDSDSSISDDEDGDGDEDDDEDDEVCSNEDGDVDNGNFDESAEEITDNNSSKSSPLSADQVRVLWMDDSETTETTTDVTVVDRGFLHGDYVAAASDPTNQIGIVVDVNISVDLLTHDGSVLKCISSRNLKRIRDFTVGDYVVLGPWLGRVDDVLDNVTVLLDDGSVCKVTKADPLHLKPVDKNVLEDGHFPYHPGQRVKASSSSVFKNSRWLSGLWKANRLEGTVTKVTIGSVFIYWIASAGYGPDSATTPAAEQSPKNLKLLSCFAHANWQLGDWCLLPSSLVSSSTSLDKGLSKLETSSSAKDEPEAAETEDDSDAEVRNSEESNGNSKPMANNKDASLDINSQTFENNAPEELDICTSSVSVAKESVHETWPLPRKKIRKVVFRKDKKARKKIENFERAVLIVNTMTKVDVAWQDGTIKRDLDSTSLIPIDSPGDHEFVAEQYVVEKASDDSDDAVEIRRVGVVKSVNAKERTAIVRWLKPVARAEVPREFDGEEVVSVYELEGHPDYDYCYGDVVVRLSPVSVPGKVDSSMESVEEPNQIIGSNESKQDKKRHPGSKKVQTSSGDDVPSDFSDLSWVGNITGLKNGDIEVTWADGMISTVGPQAIYVVGRDDDESIATGSEANDDAGSWETVEDDDSESVENSKQDLRTDNERDIRRESEESDIVAENSGKNGALSIPLAALGFVTRLASGIFSRGRQRTDLMDLDSISEDELQSEGSTLERDTVERDTNNESSCQKPSDSDNHLAKFPTNGKGEVNDAAEAQDLLEIAEALCNLKPPGAAPGPCDEDTSRFKGFDIVRDPRDQYFLGAHGQNNAGRKWLKKVQQDWNILRNNLPEGIYVRVYEDRMDLLRAVIVGPYGTPYQDGLFFFDFHLPPEYPDVPPSAYYHSGGWRINPNLYEEGKVCLSLLNTWAGRGNEVWDPSSSSILQVLVSLQGLVLNSKPYFNEAGYDKQIGTAEGEKNSLSYNENTYLLNCKTMMYLMRKPPKDFEELVVQHFRRRGHYILKACDAYMKGHLIGSLTEDASVSSNSHGNLNSVGFKLMLDKIVPKLFIALNEVGADCQDFKHLQKL
ncbi:probable ubiquitin-conjugating enzyme E2 23 isoform X1 [Olea europaea var. sylvestris]|uniref:probable ubiquitin-conjugating enzyme E2 23 isoform X1 n=2 Tax=Olea europaea var. sylvestris TaxID=158386 RepID=UPI000C1D0B15|nr:probable ubiquitin-conjugating enzyme E2 23 isoform X1 [Olea europaea var. sylvestris]